MATLGATSLAACSLCHHPMSAVNHSADVGRPLPAQAGRSGRGQPKGDIWGSHRGQEGQLEAMASQGTEGSRRELSSGTEDSLRQEDI